MQTEITHADVSGSSELADEIIEMMVFEAVQPGRAASALAIALGRVCAQFGVSTAHALLLVREAALLEEEGL